MKRVKILLSYDEIKEKYMKSDRFLWRLLYRLFANNSDMDIRKYVLNNLKGLEVKMKELICQRYDDGEPGKQAIEYGK